MDLLAKRAQLIKQIKRTGGYLYVDITEINYPDKTDHYMTLDVISKNQPERLHWVRDEHYVEALQGDPPDLLDKMLEYTHLSEHIMQTEPAATRNITCPVYHCFMGFEHPQLKPYLAVFNEGVTHNKAFILHALNEEKDPLRKASAVLLVGHFSDPQEIINVLLPHINDADSGVRNNSMRVIAMTLLKEKNLSVNAKPFLQQLNSPYLSDRNKALFVLYDLAHTEEVKKDIILYGVRLLALLELKQPNQHDTAYLILKQISGQDFGERNISAWQDWLSIQQASI